MNLVKKDHSWFGRHKALTIISGIIGIIIMGSIAAAGSEQTNINTNSVNTSASSSDSRSAIRPASTAHVGSAINIGGSQGLAVTLQQVIDPATPENSYLGPDAGKRFIALKLQIVNNGSSAYSDDANNNLTLIGSDNQSYTASFYPINECTNFSNGQYTLSAGSSATGCVVYQVPNEVKTAKVQFQTNSGFSGDTGEWLVP